jgi:hypothetical protein
MNPEQQALALDSKRTLLAYLRTNPQRMTMESYLCLTPVGALDSILHGRFTSGASQNEWRRHESEVIEEAGRRCPEVAHELGIRPHQIQ